MYRLPFGEYPYRVTANLPKEKYKLPSPIPIGDTLDINSFPDSRTGTYDCQLGGKNHYVMKKNQEEGNGCLLPDCFL